MLPNKYTYPNPNHIASQKSLQRLKTDLVPADTSSTKITIAVW